MAKILQSSDNILVWGERHNFVQGFDPLGMQPTSVATYSYLLPGITNQTYRIRYYGFYCWLFSEYSDRQMEALSMEQYNVLRRAELIIALMMNVESPDAGQIPGTDHARRMIEQGGPYDLITNGDRGSGTYWLGGWGALGQYYYGPMHEMGLLTRDEAKLFRCSDSASSERIHGRAVANAFRSNLELGAADLFFARLVSGTITDDDLRLLYSSFAIDQVKPESDEWELYVKLLRTVDHPTQPVAPTNNQNREWTIRDLIFQAGEDRLEGADDLSWVYYWDGWADARERGEPCALWLIYQMNELWQYGSLAIFHGFQTALREEIGPRQIDAFVKECVQRSLSKGTKQMVLTRNYVIGNSITDVVPEENELVELIRSQHRKGPWENTIMQGTMLLLRLAERNMDAKHEMHAFAQSKGILRSGHVFDGMEMIFRSEGDTLEKFLSTFITRWLVVRHPFEAVRKAGTGTKITLKFLLDDQNIRAIRDREAFPPQFTSPRLRALANILIDLGILERKEGLIPGPFAHRMD